MAWGLITWGIFGFNSRAWAISVGLFFAFVELVEFYVIRYEAMLSTRRQADDE